MNFFSLDGPFYKYGTILFDMLALSFFWLFISFISFGILIGPSTVALYHSAHESIIHQSSSTLKSFFSTFKNKFKYALIGWLIAGVITILSILAINMINVGGMPSLLFPIYVAIIIYISMMALYYVALTAMTTMKFKALIKYSFLLSIKHLPTTILLLIILAVSGVILYQTNFILIFIMPAGVALITSYFLTDKTLKKYDFSVLEPEEIKSIDDI